jgi:hypothetical protein
LYEIELIPLSVVEAEKLDSDIVKYADGLRERLLKMYEGSGWAALGFISWQAYLKDVSVRAGVGPKQLRKIHNVARLEAGAGYDLGSFKEGSIRPIIDGLSSAKGFDESDRITALELAIELAGDMDSVTALVSRAAASYVVVEKTTPKLGRRLVTRMRYGEVSPRMAGEICTIMKSKEARGLEPILAEVSHTKLAVALVNARKAGGDTWLDLEETIMLSGMVPTGDERQVPIDQATSDDLIGYLNAPARMKRYEKAIERTQLLTEIAKAAAKVMIEYHGLVSYPVSQTLGLNEKEFADEIKLYELLLLGNFIRHK